MLGCVAQQEGEKIFERAPHVSMVCGSASYRNLPQMLVQIEAGNRHVPDLTTARPTSASRPNSPLAPIRTAATSPSLKVATSFAPTAWFPLRAEKSAAGRRIPCSPKLARWPISVTREIQLLGQNVNSYKDPAGKSSFAELLVAVGEIAGIKRVRFTTSHPRDFGKDIVEAIEAVPTLCDHVHLPVQSGSSRVLDAMQRLYTREQYLERISWMKSATPRDQPHHRHHRRLPRRNRSGIRADLSSARFRRIRRRFLL